MPSLSPLTRFSRINTFDERFRARRQIRRRGTISICQSTQTGSPRRSHDACAYRREHLETSLSLDLFHYSSGFLWRESTSGKMENSSIFNSRADGCGQITKIVFFFFFFFFLVRLIPFFLSFKRSLLWRFIVSIVEQLN